MQSSKALDQSRILLKHMTSFLRRPGLNSINRPFRTPTCFLPVRMNSSYPTRRFAPLAQGVGQDEVDGTLVLKGIVFDVDGTLCLPQNYMFGEMRKAIGATKQQDILEFIYELPEDQQEEAHEKIRAIERTAMKKQVPQAGLVELMQHLDAKGIKKGICTRNFNTPVEHLLRTHLPSHIDEFAPIVTRDFRPPKPSPGGILHIAKSWGIIKDSDIVDHRPISKRPIPLIMVGDSIDDIIAGHDAGAATVLLRSEGKEDLEKDPRTDLVISRLDELVEILENGFEGRKLD